MHHLHYRLVNGLKMLLFFGVGNSSLRHFGKNKKYILVLGEEPKMD